MESGSTREVRVAMLVPSALKRDSVARALEGQGLIVPSRAATPESFLAHLRQDRPDLGLLDLATLGEEGFKLLEDAHQFHPEVPLLVLLSAVSPSSVERCLRAGASGYLDQDAEGCEGLCAAIHALARGERVFPALFLETFVRARSSPGNGSSVLQALSARERQVLAYLATGSENGRIAGALRISERTVKAHVSSLYRKLNQQNRTQLALLARQLGVRPPNEASPPPRQ